MCVLSGFHRLLGYCLSVAVFSSGLVACQAPLASNTLLFQDDFSQVESAWELQLAPESQVQVKAGTLNINVQTTQLNVWSLAPDVRSNNALITVQAQSLPNAPTDNGFGVICGYSDAENFYYALVSADGYASLGQVQAGELKPFQDWQAYAAIPSEPAVLTLTVGCLPNTLNLQVNGQAITTVQLPATLPVGRVGLLAKSFFEPAVAIKFDNFQVRTP
jgi:hypothetical protein